MLKRTCLCVAVTICLILSQIEARELPVLSGIGGDFSAINTEGVEVKFSALQGSIVLLAFGYTNCADICPFTLGYLKTVYQALTPEQQQQTRVVFVTVDPIYDTPEHLKAYMSHFSPDFVGLTGSRAQIDRIVSLYQAEYRPLSERPVATKHIRRTVPKKGADETQDTTILYSHSVQIFLIDKRGYTRGLAFTGTPKAELVTDLLTLMNETP